MTGDAGDHDPTAYDPGYGPLVQTRVRVATWNLWGRYGPWEARLPVVVENLRAIDADVLALQEVWEDDARSQARELADVLGCTEPVYAANLERDGARSGNAVLSRWPVARHQVRVLPRRGDFDAVDEEGEERLCVFAEIDGPRGPIQLFNAHLSWSSDHSAIRQEQLRDIARFMTSTRPRSFPAVLCGDLNAEPHSDEIRMMTGRSAPALPRMVFRDAWEAAGNTDPGFTWCNANPFAAASLDTDRRVDHVLVGQPKLGGVGHVVDARIAGDITVDGMWGSDHLAVVVELRY
ncbi:MAG TPA: endonuclease/exonuclease/phosphatase family protein [Acidimicrobiia bacterium]